MIPATATVRSKREWSSPLSRGFTFRTEKIGVRIEDDVLVTADGYKILTEHLPRTADEVEAMMAAAPIRLKNKTAASRPPFFLHFHFQLTKI